MLGSIPDDEAKRGKVITIYMIDFMQSFLFLVGILKEKLKYKEFAATHNILSYADIYLSSLKKYNLP